MDDGGSLSSVIIIVILIIGAFYFAICETAFASVSRTRLKVMADKGNTSAKRALFITDNFERAITTILICTNIIHILAASIVTVNVTRIWGVSAVTLSTIIFTLIIFFFGEMLPKSIGRKYSEKFSLATSGILSFFMTILKPFAVALAWLGNAVAKMSKGDNEVSVTEDELYDIIEDMTEAGTLDEDQGELISSALQFQDVTVESILTSRVDIVSIDVDSTPEEIIEIIKNGNHSRLPVYENTIDKIIGILQIRKYIKAYLKKENVADIRSFLDAPIFVHQSAKIDDVLETMQKEKANVAVVTDNYGGTLGIVTVEDILEELVGEIWDEDDYVQESIIQITDSLYSIDATEPILTVLDVLDIDYNDEVKEEYENKIMSELAFENFTEIPEEGDSFRFLNTLITVQMMKENRILRLKLKKLDEKEEEA